MQGAWATRQERAPPRRWRSVRPFAAGVPGVGGARGRERAGPTRSHPEPGRDPAQRRRVLWGRPHGRRGRRGHPPPPKSGSRGGEKSRSRGGAQDADGQDETQLIAETQYPSRGGAAAARWAHNPKVGGSNPPPATQIESDRVRLLGRFFLLVTAIAMA